MAVTRKTIGRQLPDGTYIEAQCELREAEDGERFVDGLSPAFSVTGAVYDSHGTWSGAAQKRNGREADSCGCCHEAILRAFPQLGPLVDVHLANPAGVPMHGEANGWYFYSGDARRYEEARPESYYNREGLTDHERGARALNIPACELPEGLNREEFARFCAGLAADRWPAMATAARDVLDSLTDGAGVIEVR